MSDEKFHRFAVAFDAAAFRDMAELLGPIPRTPRADVRWRDNLVAQGYRQKAFFLSPAALDALADLARLHGSELDAVEAALLAAANPPRSEYD